MKAIRLYILLAIIGLLAGCKTNESLTYRIETGTFTKNGEELSEKEVEDLVFDDTRNDAPITVIWNKENKERISLGQFKIRVEQVLEDVNEYYHPTKEFDKSGYSAGPEDPFNE